MSRTRSPVAAGEPLGIRPETIAVLKEGLRAVVAEGTGWRARLRGIEVGGKTGSAQVVGRARLEQSPTEDEFRPHAWFLAFAPVEQPTIALAVLVEHGGSGSASAAPVAREILAHYFRLASAPAGEARLAEAGAEE